MKYYVSNVHGVDKPPWRCSLFSCHHREYYIFVSQSGSNILQKYFTLCMDYTHIGSTWFLTGLLDDLWTFPPTIFLFKWRYSSRFCRGHQVTDRMWLAAGSTYYSDYNDFTLGKRPCCANQSVQSVESLPKSVFGIISKLKSQYLFVLCVCLHFFTV